MGPLYTQAHSSDLGRAVLGFKLPSGQPNVSISAFLDEGGPDILQQAVVFSALGCNSFAGRSCTYGGRATHFEDLNAKQLIAMLAHIYQETGVWMAEFGTRIGKAKVNGDGTLEVRGQLMNREAYFNYVERVFHLAKEVSAANNLRPLGRTPLQMRLFDLYPGAGRTHEECYPQFLDLTGHTLELAKMAGLMPGFEVEANIWGQSAANVLKMAGDLPGYQTVLDVGNLDSLGFGDQGSAAEISQLLPVIAPWGHIKAFIGPPKNKPGEKVDEEAINRFGPCHLDQAHHLFFKLLRNALPEIEARHRLQPGEFRLTLEPHILRGGQFGGFSSPQGIGVALRSLCYLLSHCGIGYSLTQFDDLRPDIEALVLES